MAIPDGVRRTTIYVDRAIDDEFRALLTEQGLGLGVGFCIAMQHYLKQHGKPIPNDGAIRIRSRTDFYRGEGIAS